jgi:hypothetical protein
LDSGHGPRSWPVRSCSTCRNHSLLWPTTARRRATAFSRPRLGAADSMVSSASDALAAPAPWRRSRTWQTKRLRGPPNKSIWRLMVGGLSAKWTHFSPSQNSCRCWLFFATLTIRLIQKIIANEKSSLKYIQH